MTPPSDAWCTWGQYLRHLTIAYSKAWDSPLLFYLSSFPNSDPFFFPFYVLKLIPTLHSFSGVLTEEVQGCRTEQSCRKFQAVVIIVALALTLGACHDCFFTYQKQKAKKNYINYLSWFNHHTAIRTRDTLLWIFLTLFFVEWQIYSAVTYTVEWTN